MLCKLLELFNLFDVRLFALCAAGTLLVFCAISVVGLLLTELLMFLFTSHLHVYFMVSKLISSILVFFWNFLARKFILYPGKIHEKCNSPHDKTAHLRRQVGGFS